MVSAGVVLTLSTQRFLGDMGLGAGLVNPVSVWPVFAFGFLAVAVGWAAWRASKRDVGAVRWAVTWACPLATMIAAPVALIVGYPRDRPGSVVANETRTGEVLWRSRPTRVLSGMRVERGELVVFGGMTKGCDYRLVTVRLDPGDGSVRGRRSVAARPQFGPVATGSAEAAGGAPVASGMRLDPAGRLVSDQGWSISVDPLKAPIIVLSTPDVVYVGTQGESVHDCSN